MPQKGRRVPLAPVRRGADQDPEVTRLRDAFDRRVVEVLTPEEVTVFYTYNDAVARDGFFGMVYHIRIPVQHFFHIAVLLHDMKLEVGRRVIFHDHFHYAQ